MNTRQLLLDAIRRNRAEDLPRLMFADYLEGEAEPREPERAEFIRLSIAAGVDRENGWTLQPHIHHPNKDKFAAFRNGVYIYRRGFACELTCPWEDWSANAARILPEHPALELVRLTTPPVIDYRRHQRTEPDRHHLTLEARAAGMRATAERVVSRRELAHSSLDLIAVTRNQLRDDLRPESVLASFWGGDPAHGKWGVRFELPRPDSHGGQYRHWEPGMRYRHTPEGAAIESSARDLVRRMAEQYAANDAAAVERILLDLLDEHGITEDDLRSGRREVTRLTTDDRGPPTLVRCNCPSLDRPTITAAFDLPDEATFTIQTIELRWRRWRLGGPSERTRRDYIVTDGICPRCRHLYFAVTREERR